MEKRFVAVAVLAGVLAVAGGVVACDGVSIGHLPWHGSKLVAAIQARILEAGFGCDVELVEMMEQPVLEAVLRRGAPDLVVGVWLHEIAGDARQAVIDGELIALGDVFGGGSREGWWMPAYFAEGYPDIRTVADIKANAHFFYGAGGDKGVFHNCPINWACRVINDNLFQAYGLGEAFVNVPAVSGEALRASIEAAGRLQMPWFGYYWAPNAVLGEHPMVMVEMNELDSRGFRCNASAGCERPHAGRYPVWRVLTIGRRAFVDAHGPEVQFIRDGVMPEATMNGLLRLLESDGMTVDGVVDGFLRQESGVWVPWMTGDVAAQVAAALE